MKIFSDLKNLRKTEKEYTRRILKKLMVVERDRLYADLRYPSLFKYIIKELGYSEAEATIRVNAVKLMLKSKIAEKKIENGELSLTNAAAANKSLKGENSGKLIEKIVERASEESSRGFKDFIAREFDQVRRETLVLEEFVLKKFDRLRKKYGDHSNLELLLIVLERELRATGLGAPGLGAPAAATRPTRLRLSPGASCESAPACRGPAAARRSHASGRNPEPPSWRPGGPVGPGGATGSSR